jgi:hypothetical protein
MIIQALVDNGEDPKTFMFKSDVKSVGNFVIIFLFELRVACCFMPTSVYLGHCNFNFK